MNDQLKAVQLARDVPFDFAAAQSMGEWRGGLVWPVAQSDASSLLLTQLRGYIDLIGRLPADGPRDAVILGGPLLLSRARALTLAALCVQSEDKINIRFNGGPPELDSLRGGGGTTTMSPLPDPTGAPIDRPLLRRMMRIRTWTSPWRLPFAVFAPRIVAISHNPLLRAAAKASNDSVGFHHAESLLTAARAGSGSKPAEASFDVGELADAVAGVLSDIDALDETYGDRLRSLIASSARMILEQATHDMAALATFAGVPESIWSGTGGKYSARALGLEVLRRGGKAVRYAHGGTTGMIEASESLAFTEFAASSGFAVPTSGVADGIDALGTARVVERFRDTEVVNLGNGDPFFTQVPRSTGRVPRARRKVIYAPTVLYGFRQLVPPLLPDLVYLDWQLRLAETLLDLPIDLLCKPHPEGLLRGQPHPLAQAAPATMVPFEEVRDDADAFVFDYSSTTTFWEALCTDRPVVFIDLTIERFSKTAAPMIERRCRIVKATFDADNRPKVDRDELAEALLGGPDRHDPTEFRRELGGEA